MKDNFYGTWTHTKTGKKYEAGGVISVKSRLGNWDKHVIYKDPETDREYARDVYNFRQKFTQDNTKGNL